MIASVFTMLLIGFYSFESLTWLKVLGGEFVVAIMVYYILLWLVKMYCLKQIPLVFLMVTAVTLVCYYFFPYKHETGEKGLYGISTLFRWVPYFGVMLLGAYVGKTRGSIKFSFWPDLLKLLLCGLSFYGIQLAAKRMPEIAPWQIVTVPLLYGIVFYSYKCCNAEWLKKLYHTHWANNVIMVIGGLCLESYLIQWSVITDRLNSLFPLNLLVIDLAVLAMSYVVRCVARTISQTFGDGDYDWAKVFALK